MRYLTIPPPEKLARLVRCFWVLEGEVRAGDGYVHRTLADGCVEIVFHYRTIFDEITAAGGREKSFAAGVSGQSRRFRRFVADRDFGIFGAYLYPFAVPQIFSHSAADLSDRMIDIESFLGREGKELEERIMTAASNARRAELLAAFLEDKLDQKRLLNSPALLAVSRIIHADAPASVAEMAGPFGFSKRQFERKFKELSGFSPKLFQRIVRFQAAAARYGGDHRSLTEIAYDCGYYDQSHFIHDFKEFSGHHPKAYFSGRAEGTEWR